MADELTPEAKAEIATAFAIVKSDKDRATLRAIHKHVTTPPAPTPTPEPTPTPTTSEPRPRSTSR